MEWKRNSVYIRIRTYTNSGGGGGGPPKFGGGGGGGGLPKILGVGVPHGSQNPDPISDQKI